MSLEQPQSSMDYQTVVEIIRKEVMPQLERLGTSLEEINKDRVTRAEFRELRNDFQMGLTTFGEKYLSKELAEATYVTKDAHQQAVNTLREDLNNKGWNLYVRSASVISTLALILYLLLYLFAHYHP